MKRHDTCWQDMANQLYQRSQRGRHVPLFGEATCKQLRLGHWRFQWGDFTWVGEACCQHRARAEGIKAYARLND